MARQDRQQRTPTQKYTRIKVKKQCRDGALSSLFYLPILLAYFWHAIPIAIYRNWLLRTIRQPIIYTLIHF